MNLLGIQSSADILWTRAREADCNRWRSEVLAYHIISGTGYSMPNFQNPTFGVALLRSRRCSVSNSELMLERDLQRWTLHW